MNNNFVAEADNPRHIPEMNAIFLPQSEVKWYSSARGENLFDFNSDNQFVRASARVVALRQEKQTLEARRRDIYESHRHRAFSVAYYMTGNELEAEQILTGTFVTAFRAAEEPSAQDVDAALIRELQQRFPLQAEAAAPVTLSTDGFDLSGRNVKRTDLEEAIQELPAAERLLFLLRDVEGYTSTAIAGLLRVPETQVNRRLFAARIHLRQALAELRNNEEKAA